VEEALVGRIENLKPWPKGVSGHPGGRPRKKLIDEALEELLSNENSAVASEIAEKLFEKASKGTSGQFNLSQSGFKEDHARKWK